MNGRIRNFRWSVFLMTGLFTVFAMALYWSLEDFMLFAIYMGIALLVFASEVYQCLQDSQHGSAGQAGTDAKQAGENHTTG